MKQEFLFYFLVLSLSSAVEAFDTGLTKVTEAGGKLAEAGGNIASKFSPESTSVELQDEGWTECPEPMDTALNTMRDFFKGMGNPLTINTTHQFCEYIQIHNLETIQRSGMCGSRKCTDGKKECYDQTIRVKAKLKLDCAFHTLDAIKKWLADQGLSLPTGILKKRSAGEGKNTTTSSSTETDRYFLHAECTNDCEINMLLKLNWGENKEPEVVKAGYSTGGLAALFIYWTGDTAAAAFLEWLSKAPFMRGFFGLFVQFAMLFVMPGILSQKELTPSLSALNCGD